MLEDLARKYAITAVRADKEGRKDDAITNYQRAIDVLTQLVALYPDSVARHAYEQMINEYKKRIQVLKEMLPEGDSPQEKTSEVIVLSEKPKVRFDDIVGLDNVKEALRESIIYPSMRPDLFPLGWPRGILLYGPPGCGKTMIAAAVANEIDSEFMHIDAASVMSKWLGESEKNVSKVFVKARELSKQENKPVVVFIDELDALLGSFNNEIGGEARVRNQFLKEMDGLQDKSETFKVYVIGATNKPWKLDEAFIRRFQKRIYIGLPDREQRVELFRFYTSKIKTTGLDIQTLAEKAEGYTASDIRDLVQTAHMIIVKEMFKTGSKEPRPVTMKEFEEAFKLRKPSVSAEITKIYEAWQEKFKAL
ncbi:ATPase AAA [Sulfolobales archaeon HS-7]|nr:ATPase AAA [Sulfolobales archaeon HS-7]